MKTDLMSVYKIAGFILKFCTEFKSEVAEKDRKR